MSVKSMYYKLSTEEFDAYLLGLKNAPGAKTILACTSHPYFYSPTPQTTGCLLELHKLLMEFDHLMGSFTAFAQKQLVQSFLLDEIEATNSIENIQSTRHDIFSVISKAKTGLNKKVVSIVNSYELLLDGASAEITELKHIRATYDALLKGALAAEDKPDGALFRKGPVFVTDGIKNVHIGISGEEAVCQAMDEFLQVYNEPGDIFERMILAHFILETAHPYYDGNGRLGRYFFSQGLFSETNSYASLLVSKALASEKAGYYAALKQARDIHEFGCLNSFVGSMASILAQGWRLTIDQIRAKQNEIASFQPLPGLTKSQQRVHRLIAEATVLSDYGISGTEIQNCLGLSKRTVISAIKLLNEKHLLTSEKVGLYTYYRLR